MVKPKSVFVNLLIKMILGTLFIACLFKVVSLRVLASERRELSYYGDFIHDYDLYLANNDGSYDKIHVTTDNNTYPILIYFTNWKSLRLAYFQFGQASSDALAYEFSNDFGNSNFRTYAMNTGITSYEPYLRYRYIYQTTNNQTLPINTNWYVEGLPLFISNNFAPTVLDYLNCVNTWYADQKGGEISADVTVDTSNIEQLITDSNTIATDTKTVVSDIKDEIISNSSSQITFGEEEKALMASYKEWLILIGFCVALLLSRTVLHQMGRNIRGRS